MSLSATAIAQTKVDAQLFTYSGSCSNCDLSNKTMTRMQLQNADMSGSIFNRSNLSGGKFDNSNLSGTHFRRAYLVGVSGDMVNLENSIMPDATMIEANLSASNLRASDLRRVDMTRAKFKGSIFNDADLISVSAEDADFSNAEFINARADHIDLEGANMSNTKLNGVKFGSAVFNRTTLDGSDLSGADLRSVSGLTQAQLDTACGDYKTRLPRFMSIAYCKPDLNTMTAHATLHKNEDTPEHIHRAAEDLDDALRSIENLLSKANDKKSRRTLQSIHADVMAARDALEQ
ncbi:MAG: pentapeptide repeat-containing protein [Maricaulaceae bacterium]